MPYQTKSPILFLVFNRPEQTRQTFDVLRKARPLKLYVAADGPRADRVGEASQCATVREIATAVDWVCEVTTLFREENLGCGEAVSSAITWFFENEELGLIIEDDVKPHLTWFRFADEMLQRYKDDEGVMCVTAHSHDYSSANTTSYTYSRYNHCWGWASWRRAWQNYDFSIKEWPMLRNSDWLLKVGHGSRAFHALWTRKFDKVYAGDIDTWDYQWMFACWLNSGLSIHPSLNMVENIGVGADATHTNSDFHKGTSLKAKEMSYPLKHPTVQTVDIKRERYIDRTWFGITWIRYVKYKLGQFKLIQWLRSLRGRCN